MMHKELVTIRELLEFSKDSMEIAIRHFGRDSLFGNAFQHDMAKERKSAFRGAVRKLDKLITKSNVDSTEGK